MNVCSEQKKYLIEQRTGTSTIRYHLRRTASVSALTHQSSVLTEVQTADTIVTTVVSTEFPTSQFPNCLRVFVLQIARPCFPYQLAHIRYNNTTVFSYLSELFGCYFFTSIIKLNSVSFLRPTTADRASDTLAVRPTMSRPTLRSVDCVASC